MKIFLVILCTCFLCFSDDPPKNKSKNDSTITKLNRSIEQLQQLRGDTLKLDALNTDTLNIDTLNVK